MNMKRIGRSDKKCAGPPLLLSGLYALTFAALSPNPQVGLAQEWHLSPQPVLSIGSMAGSEAEQLYRVSGAHRLSNGGVGVVNAGSREIRFFGPDGRHRVTLGRRGGGPNEFEMPILAGSVGDTLIVVDQAHHRFTLVHPIQGFVAVARISNDVGGFLNAAGCFRDGTTVFGGAFDMRRIGELHNGLNRAHTFYRSADLDGSLAVDFGNRPGADFFIRDLGGRGPDARPALIPFGRVPLAATSPEHLFLSDQDDWAIQVYAPSGELVRVIRQDWDPVPISARDRRAYIQESSEEMEDPAQREEYERYVEGLPLPENFPPFSRLLGDLEGYLWVQEFRRPGEGVGAWRVFDPEGNPVAWVSFPERFRPLEIGRDYVLGLSLDEVDVEHIQVFALIRNGTG